MVKIKPKRLYWWYSNYALSKVIVDNGLEDLCRRENSDFPEFTHYDKSFGKNPGEACSILVFLFLNF